MGLKTLLCGIGRQENQYIREWVEYNKAIGFTNIVLYDNNYDGEDHFEDVIGDYIDSGYVILKNYRNLKTCQLNAYNSCYKEYGDKYDWIAFFDCDEFLTLTKKKSVEEYLSSIVFKNFDMIHINWMCYGDGGMATNDGRPLLERITTPVMPLDKPIGYNFPENCHIKSVIRGHLEKPVLFTQHPHSATVERCCNERGIRLTETSSPFSNISYTEAYLRHFSTKTAEEYANKMKKGFPDREWNIDKEAKFLIETRFFRYNDITEEKINIFKEKLGIDMSYLLETPIQKRKDVQLFMLCYDKEEYGFIDNEVMTPLQCGASNGKNVCKLKDNTGNNISTANFFFVENTGTYWIWQNIKDAKYKGQTQYRRRLEGIDEKTDYEKIFTDYDVICAQPYNYPANHDAFIPSDTVLGGYAYSHCKEDLEILGDVIKESYPDYTDDWDKYIVNGQNLYYSNGFVLPAEKYDEYCAFLFDTLGKWLQKTKITTYEELIVHVVRNLSTGKYIRYEREGKDPMKLEWPGINWQVHIGGFLSERLWTLWLEHNIPMEKRYQVGYQKMENMYI